MPSSRGPSLSDLPVVTHPAAIDAAGRAVVYCYAEWGEPRGRAAICTAVARLRAAPDPVAFEFFVIDEDAAAFDAWLVSHLSPGRPKHAPSGAGVVLWLEGGRCVATVVGAEEEGVGRLVDRTESLWGSGRHNQPLQRTGAAGILSRVGKWFGRGPGR